MIRPEQRSAVILNHLQPVNSFFDLFLLFLFYQINRLFLGYFYYLAKTARQQIHYGSDRFDDKIIFFAFLNQNIAVIDQVRGGNQVVLISQLGFI